MKKLLFPLLILGLVFTFNACDETKDDDSGEIGNEQTGEPKDFSDLKPEDHKAKLTDEAILMIDEVESLAKSDAVKASVNMMDLMGMMDEEEEPSQKSAALSVMNSISEFGKGEASIFDLMVDLRRIQVENEDTPDIEQEYKDSVAGTYTWNPTKVDFDKEAGDKLIVKFPATGNTGENNAIFTVEEFKFKYFEDPLDEEIPTNLAANLTVDGTKVIDFSFTGSYNADGVPSSIAASLKIAGFELSASLKNDDMKKATAEYGLKHADKNIIKLSAGVQGDFSESNIEENTYWVKDSCWETQDYYWDCEDVPADENDPEAWEEVDFENILNKAYGFADIFNIRIGGEVDVLSMVPEMDKIYENEHDHGFDWKAAAEKEAEVMNKYLDFYAAYVSSKLKIADIEFFVVEDDETWMDCYWDHEQQKEVCQEVKDYWVDGRLVFGDDSKVDAETFVKTGFSKFFDEVNAFIKEMNTLYGDYGLDMDEVDYETMFDEEEE